MTDSAMDQAVIDAFPCLPVPPSGDSQAIAALRAAPTTQATLVGRDGVMLLIRRPWLSLDFPIAKSFHCYLPYGSIGRSAASLRCGKIPQHHWDEILAHFIKASPNEASAFVIWDEHTREFLVTFPKVLEFNRSRISYVPPTLQDGQHVVVDLHSHGEGKAFFSATDDIDDAHSTKIAIVVGQLGGKPSDIAIAQRLCAGGMFLPFMQNPFSG